MSATEFKCFLKESDPMNLFFDTEEQEGSDPYDGHPVIFMSSMNYEMWIASPDNSLVIKTGHATIRFGRIKYVLIDEDPEMYRTKIVLVCDAGFNGHEIRYKLIAM